MGELLIPLKPKYGSPCNHCGMCCASEICLIGKEVLGNEQEAPCPFLRQLTNTETNETKLVCHLVVTEMAIGKEPLIQEALGIGKRCDSDD